MVANVVLCLIIAAFWLVALSRIKEAGHKISITLLILPFFFGAIGYFLNQDAHGWTGTIVVGAIHLGLLVMLALRSTRGQK